MTKNLRERVNYNSLYIKNEFSMKNLCLIQVDFIWINRDQKAFEWFLTILNQIELEQNEHHGALERCIQIHLYMTAAQKKTDMKGIGLQVCTLWGALHLRTFCNKRCYLLHTFCDFNCALLSHPNQEELAIFIDGTFKCCTKICHQMYQIHGLCSGHYVPLVFMLLPGKSTFTVACGVPYNLYVKDIKLLNLPFEEAMHTVLTNAHCTFKNEL